MERISKDTKSLLTRLLFFIEVFLFFTTSVKGQEVSPVRTEQDSLFHHISREMSAEFSCHFTYAQGSGVISSEPETNAAELKRLDTFIRRATSHPTLVISRILLTGYSSIEGSYARNEALARERVEQFCQYLRKHYPELYSYPCDLAWVAEDWNGLFVRVKASRLKEREEILGVIRKVSVYDIRKELLMKLNGGYAWLFMQREIFPGLRRVELKVEYTASPQPSPKERGFGHAASDSNSTISDSSSTEPVSLSFGEGRGEAVGELRGEAVGELRGEAVFSIKTNLLLWAGVQSDFRTTTPVANAALEYYIDKHWSVEAGAMYGYWHYNSKKKFQGISGYRLEPRYRFALLNDRFEAYLGIYGRVGDYDSRKSFDNDAQPNSQFPTLNSQLNCTGDYWDAGVSAGLTFRLVGGLGLEVGARAGYVDAEVIYYTREDDDNWYKSEKKYNKLRVTDLNLSLTYRF
jgi:hypothetical protein